MIWYDETHEMECQSVYFLDPQHCNLDCKASIIFFQYKSFKYFFIPRIILWCIDRTIWFDTDAAIVPIIIMFKTELYPEIIQIRKR